MNTHDRLAASLERRARALRDASWRLRAGKRRRKKFSKALDRALELCPQKMPVDHRPTFNFSDGPTRALLRMAQMLDRGTPEDLEERFATNHRVMRALGSFCAPFVLVDEEGSRVLPATAITVTRDGREALPATPFGGEPDLVLPRPSSPLTEDLEVALARARADHEERVLPSYEREPDGEPDEPVAELAGVNERTVP
jgi:hypothetical protein